MMMGTLVTLQAQLRKSSSLALLASYHRTLALGGLQDEISRFSSDNADAVLATSSGLQSQCRDYGEWAVMTEGTAKVRQKMLPFKHMSQLPFVFHDSVESFETPLLDGQPEIRHQEKLLLDSLIQSLEQLWPFVKDTPLSRPLNSLRLLLENLRQSPARPTHKAQFAYHKELRTTNIMNPGLFVKIKAADPCTLIAIAHYECTLLVATSLNPWGWFNYQLFGKASTVEYIYNHLVEDHRWDTLERLIETPHRLAYNWLQANGACTTEFMPFRGWITERPDLVEPQPHHAGVDWISPKDSSLRSGLSQSPDIGDREVWRR